MDSYVRLTTSEITGVVSVSCFQFGTVPAPQNSFELLTDSVQPGALAESIFRFDPQMVVPPQQQVRFDIRFELNVHNSAFLQLCLDSAEAGTRVQWRWAAPIGYTGTWSASEQQAPWFDDSVDYCININNSTGTYIDVTLAEKPGNEQQQCPFIPPQSAVAEMTRPWSPIVAR